MRVTWGRHNEGHQVVNVTESIEIAAPIEQVWAVIADIENCAQHISGITAVKVLNKPVDGLVGLKWQETRLMFGKEATEVMWIVEATPNEHYLTNSASHGSLYSSRLSVQSQDDKTILTMTFKGEAQTFGAKIMSGAMGVFMKGTMQKCVRKDLEDIKRNIEG
ncbi:MAG: carbon monoxide dehydrogenase subunit G [Candidatus Krumholzibacteriia bacterium]|jgi:carbon monoxide dehydrogenase subunit G